MWNLLQMYLYIFEVLNMCVLQCVAVCCSVLQCVAVCCSVFVWNVCMYLQHTASHNGRTLQKEEPFPLTAPPCDTLQHTATYCNTLQHSATHNGNTLRKEEPFPLTATHYNAIQHTMEKHYKKKSRGVSLQHTAQCNTVQHSATQCNTVQHSATQCNTLHHATGGGY